ncbi:MAG: hotdog fold thioesterase [Myxococcota bacterium]
MPASEALPPIEPEALRRSLESTPYVQGLGLSVEHVEAGRVRLTLPFSEGNSNPGGVLHGGVAASLLAIGSRSVARSVLAADSAPWTLGQLQVNYLSAAREETVHAEARLERRGRALVFVETRVVTDDDTAIAAATAVVRAGHGAEGGVPPTSFGCEGDTPGPMAAVLEKAPFMHRLGMKIEHMDEGRARIRMPARPEILDEDGAIHDGAILALLDTAGAMASWAENGIGRYRASTASLQAQALAPTPQGDVVAHARCAHRDREMFWAETEVADAATGRVTNRGTVFYRITE